jgi:hypothetical protein
MTCLEDLECAVALGANVIDSIQGRAVIVVGAPLSINLRPDTILFLLVSVLEPLVA